MRWLRFLAMVLVLSSTGCSLLIAESGQNIDRLQNREEVVAALGKPTQVGEQDGKAFEEFETRRKIAERSIYSAHISISIAHSMGLAEIVLCPYQLWMVSKRTLFGQQIRFIYNDQGEVIEVIYDGEQISKAQPASESIPPEIPVGGIDQSGGQDRD
jgi:hypothetical protein